MRRPAAMFAISAVLGGLLSLSISVGLIPLVLAVVLAVALALVWRSTAALAGALVGWGATWAVLSGSTYVRCVSLGTNCIGGEGILPFVIVGMTVLAVGLVLGWRALRRREQPRVARRS